MAMLSASSSPTSGYRCKRVTRSAVTLISLVADRILSEAAQHPSSGMFGEIASLATRRALAQKIGAVGPTLFGSSAEDLQTAVREYSTRTRFGELAEGFLSEFLSRTLRSLVDRELSVHVGAESALEDVSAGQDFMEALDVHARQTTRIARDFSGGWYSRHNWQSKGEISRDEAQKFIAYALRKVRSELKRGASA